MAPARGNPRGAASRNTAQHDVAVPDRHLSAFLDQVAPALTAILPALRINPLGAFGDGNDYLNISPLAGGTFGEAEMALSDAVYDLVADAGGSFSAEYGLGQAKIASAGRRRDRVERRLMASMLATVDLVGRMNPGRSPSEGRRGAVTWAQIRGCSARS